MSWQPSLCQEAGNVMARLLGGAVLLCVISNAIFLFYLPSRRRRGSDGWSQEQGNGSRQPADSPEGGQRVSPADRRRSTAEQRSGSGPNGWLDPSGARPEQKRKATVLSASEQQLGPGRAPQAGVRLWPPGPDTRTPGHAIADARRLPKAALGECGSLPRQRELTAVPSRRQ